MQVRAEQDFLVTKQQINETTTQSPPTSSSLPVALFKSGQLLTIKPTCRGGLILQKSFYADLIGPGSAVGGYFDIKCNFVYQLGKVEFSVPETYEDRRLAVQKRIACIRRLQSIVILPLAIDRAQRMIELLSRWLGQAEAEGIPDELAAKLAGVLPKTIILAWEKYHSESSQQDANHSINQTMS